MTTTLEDDGETSKNYTRQGQPSVGQAVSFGFGPSDETEYNAKDSEQWAWNAKKKKEYS